MGRLCGATLGLFAFSVTIFLSLAAQNTIEETLWRAWIAMICFCGIGLLVGWMVSRVLDEYAVQKKLDLFGEDEGERKEHSHTDAANGTQEDVIELKPVG